MSNYNEQTIYHILNNNLIDIAELIKEQNIIEVSIEDQIKQIEDLNEPLNAHLLNDLMNKEYMETKVNNYITLMELNKTGFTWNKINKIYLDRIFALIEGEINGKSESKNI